MLGWGSRIGQPFLYILLISVAVIEAGVSRLSLGNSARCPRFCQDNFRNCASGLSDVAYEILYVMCDTKQYLQNDVHSCFKAGILEPKHHVIYGYTFFHYYWVYSSEQTVSSTADGQEHKKR